MCWPFGPPLPAAERGPGVQASYAAHFVREMGCVEAEWLRWLPAAIGDHPWSRDGSSAAVNLHGGRLVLRWRALEPMRIGLVRMPRLEVEFEFTDLGADARLIFMRRFDLYMQRGGG